MFSLVLIAVVFLTIMAGIPITFALGLVSLVGLLVKGLPPFVLVQRLFTAIDSFPLVAIPLFILAGSLMSEGGVSRRLVRLADALIGHLPGGLALVVIVATAFLSAVTGSAIAATAAIGGIMIPALVSQGYNPCFSAALVASAGTMGPIIPPSIPLVIYGVITSTSIAKLFLGGFIPGMLMAVALAVPAYVTSRNRGYRGRETRASIREVLDAMKDAFLPLLSPIIIIGGILGGFFTATESAVVAAAFTFLLGTFVYRELKLSSLPKILRDTALSTGTVLVVLGTASVFTWFLTVQQVPKVMTDFLMTVSQSKAILLLLINLILLFAGTFIDTISAITIFTPLFYPVAMKFGVDPVHFGMIIAVNLTIGMITPPLGVCLFTAANIAGVTLSDMLRDLWPLLAALLVVLVIVTYMPGVTLFLPRLFP